MMGMVGLVLVSVGLGWLLCSLYMYWLGVGLVTWLSKHEHGNFSVRSAETTNRDNETTGETKC